MEQFCNLFVTWKWGQFRQIIMEPDQKSNRIIYKKSFFFNGYYKFLAVKLSAIYLEKTILSNTPIITKSY